MGKASGVAFAALMIASLAGCSLLKPKPKKALGQDCTDDLGCDSLTCSTVGNICSHSCTYDKDCKDTGAGNVCRRKDDGGNWCSKPVGTAPNGSCMNASDCQHNECLKRIGQESQPGICSKYCQTPDDCPNGMKVCLSISDSGLIKVCLPGDGSASASGSAAAGGFAPSPRGKPAAGAAAAPAAPAPAHTTKKR